MIDFSMIQYKKEILDALSGLLEIESVKSEGEASMPYGKGVFDALMYMLDLAEQLDLESVNVFSHVGYAEYGEGDEEVDILTHLDVVPAGDGWTVPPFKATIQDGRIYGRGTMDDKGAAVVALFVLHALKQHCVSLKKRVRLIFGCDEESGWQDMEFYRSRYPEEPAMAFSPDSEYPIVNAEKGTMHIHLKKQLDCAEGFGIRLKYLKGGTRINIVPDSAECFVEGNADLLEKALKLFADGNSYDINYEKKPDGLYVSAKGKSSHGSLPENGLNAIMILVAFLNNLPMKKSAGSDAVYALGEKIGFETDGKMLKIKCADRMGALSVNVGIADIGQDSADVALDIRYPECTDTDTIEKALLEAFPGFSIEYGHSMVPHYVSPDSELVRKLGDAYEEVTGEKAECISMGGATYARTFKNSVAFGPVFPGRECREHNSDEYILIDDLIKAGDIMASAIYKLCN